MEMRMLFKNVIQRIGIILIVFLITMGVTAYFAQKQTPVYEARTSLITKASDQAAEDRTLSSILSILSRGNAIVATYSEVAKSNYIKAKAATRLGLFDSDVGDISVTTRVVPDTNVFRIVVAGPDPTLVRDFTNAVGDETIAFANSGNSAYKLELLDPAGLPAGPIGPGYYQSLAIGAVIGLFLGICVAILSVWISNAMKETAPAQFEPAPLQEIQHDLDALRSEFSTLRSELAETKAILRHAEHDAVTIASSLRTMVNQYDGK